jgi:hypothetical protein
VHPTHPLYSEILRGRTSTLRARRIRGLIARALAGTGATRPSDVLRRGVLLLDAEHPDPEVLTSAAAHATTLGDMPLAERLARAAITSGAGVEATSILGMVLGWQGEALAAEQVLAALPDLTDTDERRVLAAVSRAAVLFFQAGEPERARQVLGDALAVVQPGARSELEAVDAVLLCFLNKPAEAIARARAVLAEAVDRDHVRLAEPCRAPALPAEPGRVLLVRADLGRQQLEGHDSIGARVVGTVDLRHPAPPQQPEDPVRPECHLIHGPSPPPAPMIHVASAAA